MSHYFGFPVRLENLRADDREDLTRTQILPAEVRDLARRVAAKRDRESTALERDMTIDAFTEDLKAMMRVLRIRDGLPVSEEHINERVANAITGFFGNYRIERLR